MARKVNGGFVFFGVVKILLEVIGGAGVHSCEAGGVYAAIGGLGGGFGFHWPPGLKADSSPLGEAFDGLRSGEIVVGFSG